MLKQWRPISAAREMTTPRFGQKCSNPPFYNNLHFSRDGTSHAQSEIEIFQIGKFSAAATNPTTFYQKRIMPHDETTNCEMKPVYKSEIQ
jgi:hypothetical protein